MKKNAHFRALTHKNFDLWPKSLQFFGRLYQD